MGLYRALHEIAYMLESEQSNQHPPETILERVVAFTGAYKAFIVVEEDGKFVQKHHIRFDATISEDKKQFSRSLVKEVVTSRETLLTLDCSEDPRFAECHSLADCGRASILVTPLIWSDQVFAVIYQERTPDDGPFSQEARLFMQEFASLASLAIYKALKHREAAVAQATGPEGFESVICRHGSMLRLLQTASLVAKSDATTLIRGETGTGKEVIARAIYANSARRNKPFVTLHCGALPETLFESELFGHRRGAFTGANRDREGRIAQANGGTLFIDEVAEIPPTAQAKLLRFFQFNEFQRIGSDKVERVDVRIIAATHRNLEKMVADGEFRQDLYYRLNVVELEIPPLRERRTDIPLLVNHFLNQNWQGPQTPQLDEDARMAFEQYDYPGNVRELGHVIERICVLAQDATISLDLLPRQMAEAINQSLSDCQGEEVFSSFTNEELKFARDQITRQAVAKVERTFLRGLLKTCQGNVAEAARKAGMHRTYLYKLLARYKTL